MKYRIPAALIYMRLGIGIFILGLRIAAVPNYPVIATSLFSIGLLTDIADGIAARYLKVSTPQFRRLDSAVDQIFFSMVAIATFLECPDFFYAHWIQLAFLIGTEVLTYVLCFLKFGKEVATHAISSKIWALILFATLIEIMLDCNSTVLFEICIYGGILTRFEIIGIILLLRTWAHDIPSVYHAWLLRNGKPIRRHKMFNG